MTGVDLSGKTALVTGATGGLGRALVTQLVEMGVDVFVSGRNETELQSLAVTYSDRPGQVVGSFLCDLARTPETLCDAIDSTATRIDILINCAGQFLTRSVGETSINDFDVMFGVNVRAPFVLSRAISKQMIDRRWGRIVNIGSTSSVTGYADTVAYCASKHALLGLSRAMNAELIENNVRVTCVCPGTLDSRMGDDVVGVPKSSRISCQDLARLIVTSLLADSSFIVPEIVVPRLITK